MQLDLLIDGLCQPRNPGGIATYAFLVKEGEKTIHSESGLAAKPFSDSATNNVAEYTALIKGLSWLATNGHARTRVRVQSDSRLLVNQMLGKFRVRNTRIVPLFKKGAVLAKQFDDLIFEWVPRAQNREADALTMMAYNNAIIGNPELLDNAKVESE